MFALGGLISEGTKKWRRGGPSGPPGRAGINPAHTRPDRDVGADFTSIAAKITLPWKPFVCRELQGCKQSFRTIPT
jgi:hypothetical protein